MPWYRRIRKSFSEVMMASELGLLKDEKGVAFKHVCSITLHCVLCSLFTMIVNFFFFWTKGFIKNLTNTLVPHTLKKWSK